MRALREGEASDLVFGTGGLDSRARGYFLLFMLLFLLFSLAACGTRTELSAHEERLVNLELDCPTSADDPRVALLSPGEEALLDASLFTLHSPDTYKWSIVPEGCDAVASNPSYTLRDAQTSRARFVPGRPYPYLVVLEVGLFSGPTNSCTFELPVRKHGFRVEACWTNDKVVDLDLFLHSPLNQEPFMVHGDFISDFGNMRRGPTMTKDSCNVYNCTPQLRGHLERADFGYPATPLEDCGAGPAPDQYLDLGICPNPRASVDNNGQDPDEVQTSGFMEVMHIDSPRPGETFRLMLRNFNNLPTSPQLFVYCNGARTEVGSPAMPPEFVAEDPGEYGLMWRPADITTQWDAVSGLGCSVQTLTHPDDEAAPYITVNRPIY